MLIADTLMQVAAIPGAPKAAIDRARIVGKAKRFVLSRQFLLAMDEAIHGSPHGIESIAAAVDFARVPAPVTWIEFATKERVNNKTPKISDGLIKITDTKRNGFLVLADEKGHPNTIHGFWKFSEEPWQCVPCLAAAVTNWQGANPNYDGQLTASPEKYAGLAGGTRESFEASFRTKNPDITKAQLDALWVYQSGMQMRPSSLADDMFLELASLPLDKAKTIVMSNIQDMADELFFVASVLIMMNARNCVSTQPIDRSVLNKSRAKSGKKPLLSFTEIKLDMTRVQARRSAEPGVDGDRRAWHFCRGHFKVRRSGVYWWGAHWRGDPTAGRVKSSYRVVDAPRDVSPPQ